MRLPHAASFYYHEIPAFGASAIVARSSASVFFGNLFFLQSIYFPSFGSDTPLWSLSYEFWYYMLFPILLLGLTSGLTLGRRLAYLLVGSAIVAMVGVNIALLFLVWLAGVAIGLLHDTRLENVRTRSPAWSTYCFGAFGVVAFVITKTNVVEGVTSDFMAAAAFLPVMYALVEARGSQVNRAYAIIAKTLSSFSYSLYLTHLPLLIFLRTCLATVPRWQPDLRHVACGTAIACTVASYSFAISRFTEARTDVVRRAVFVRRKGVREGQVRDNVAGGSCGVALHR
jgi:peptidoglycan/LPS O-acetylase OafA/YrhL